MVFPLQGSIVVDQEDEELNVVVPLFKVGTEGLKNAMNRYAEVTEQRTVVPEDPHTFVDDNVFMKEEMDRRAANFMEGALRNMLLEMSLNALSSQRTEVVFMFLRPALLQQVDWVNQRLRIKNISHCSVTEGDILGFVAVLWWSHLTNLPLQEVVDDFVANILRPPTISLSRLLSSNLCDFHPELLPQEYNFVNVTTRLAHRNYPRFVDDFKRKCYAISKGIFCG